MCQASRLQISPSASKRLQHPRGSLGFTLSRILNRSVRAPTLVRRSDRGAPNAGSVPPPAKPRDAFCAGVALDRADLRALRWTGWSVGARRLGLDEVPQLLEGRRVGSHRRACAPCARRERYCVLACKRYRAAYFRSRLYFQIECGVCFVCGCRLYVCMRPRALSY